MSLKQTEPVYVVVYEDDMGDTVFEEFYDGRDLGSKLLNIKEDGGIYIKVFEVNKQVKFEFKEAIDIEGPIRKPKTATKKKGKK